MSLRQPTWGEQAADPIHGLPNLRGGGDADPASLVRTETRPDDWGAKANAVAPVGEAAIIGELEQWFRAASDARRPHEAAWREGIQFYRGNQWGEWSSGAWVDLRDKSDPDRVYSTYNKIKPIARRLIARALSLRSEVTTAPMTGAPNDIRAARTARGLLSSFKREFADARETLRAIQKAVIVGPVWAFDYWDAGRMGPVPQFGEDGEIIGSTYEARGGICSHLLSCDEVYADPRCDTPEQMREVCIARRLPVSEIQRMYPAVAHRIKPDGGVSPGTETQSQMDSIVGSQTGKQTSVGQQTATLKMKFVLPGNPLRPQGLFVVWCSDVLCYRGDYPYVDMRNESGDWELPVTCLSWEEGVETIYGSNALVHLIPIQRTRNRLLTSVDEHARSGDGKLIAERGSGIDPLAFRSGRRNEVVYWDGPSMGGASTPPQFLQQPQLDGSIPLLLNILDADLAQIAEVNSADEGQSPYPNAAAETIQLLQDASSSTISIFRERLAEWQMARARKRLALARQYYSDKALIFRADTAPSSVAAEGLGKMMEAQGPQEQEAEGQIPGEVQSLIEQYGQEAVAQADPSLLMPQRPQPQQEVAPEDVPATQVEDFRAFKAGRVVLTVTSSIPRSAGARIQTIVDMAKAGMFMPEVLPITILMLEQMDLVESDKFVEDLLIALRSIQARQEQMQQQQQEFQAQQQQEATQAALAKQAVDHDAMMEQQAQRAGLEQQGAAQQAQAQAEAQSQQELQQQAQMEELLQQAAPEDDGGEDGASVGYAP